MKFLIAACLLAVAVSANLEELGSKFQAFKLKHGKVYQNQAEETKRFSIFQDALRAIEEHNALYEQGLKSYKQGVTRFADLTRQEFKESLGLRYKKPQFNATQYVKTGVAVADSIDWRTSGQVTAVKDQGNCGSCWSFSLTGVTEAAYQRSTGNLASLSEQQLVDCTTDLNDGCGGGYLDYSCPYIIENGLQSEESYPYTARDGTCRFDASQVVTKISSYVALPTEDENALLEAVATVGPISVAIDATDVQFYDSGIIDGGWCTEYALDHAVLVVGYGTENNTPYWLVKNSWGPSFGESGYFRLVRDKNECGITEDTIYTVI